MVAKIDSSPPELDKMGIENGWMEGWIYVADSK